MTSNSKGPYAWNHTYVIKKKKHLYIYLPPPLKFRYLRDESGLNRKNIIDNRVHCCFYFINPYGHGLKPLDIEVMKQLSDKVSIVPVIAKSDCLSKEEVSKLKKKILLEIKENGIRIYSLPECDR